MTRCLATRADARRGKVIAAARRLFAEQGFHATGVAQLARESQVLVGQIYRDFAGKEDIVAAIVEGDLESFLAEAELAAAIGRRDEAAVRAWIRQFVQCTDTADPRLIREILAEAARNPRMAQIERRLHDRLRARLDEALAMLAPGEPAAAGRAITADTILIISAGLFQHRLRNGGEPGPQVLAILIGQVDRAIDLLISARAEHG